MKKSIFIFLTLVLGISLNAKAEDFSAVYNGKTIYYNITSSSSPYTAAVKSSGSSANSYSGVISIPDSVLYSGNYYKITSINNGAFNVCNSLTSVFIPSSVISIGNYAFRICTSLTSITIPSSVSSIGLAAFSGCSGLTSITIPSSVSIIGNLAFQNCTSLDTVFFNAINCNINDSQTGPIFIGCINLNSIIIGDNVIRIPGNVFNDCTGLTSIIIPDSVISIGVSAFQNCSSLTSITIPSFVTSISNNTFYGCTELTSITIPNSIISIGESAFKNCTSLDTVFFNAVNCNVMGTNSNFVFDGCNNLSTIIFGDNVNNIPKNAFKDRIGITSVKISSSVISIGAFAFDGCIGLTLLNIPNSITSIGGGAFHNCTSLDTVFFNPINCHTMSNVPYEVFRGCSNFKTLIIGDSVQVIPNYAFRGRSGLTSVNIPSSVTTIGASAFYECSGIKKITIPSYVTKIGNLAFTLCSSLDTVFFNAINCDTTGSFDNPILGNCINFKTLIIGDSVQSIPSYAFYYCNKLTSITCKSISPPSVQSTSFSYVSKSIPFYVPCLSKSYYQSAANLSAFTNFIGVTTPTFISATICQGDTYNNYGFYFIANTSGLYTQNIQLINGCDSVINLNLIVNPSYNDTIFAKIFNGQTYNQFGFNETNKGFYTQNLQTTIGCDSIVNLSLSFEPIYVDTISASICQGQTYTLYGFNEDSIGFYTQSLITSEGFDSIINLNLMVNPIYNDTVYAEICNGDTYNQFGFNESAAGLYTKSLQTTKGCDSMINLSLTLNPTYHDTIYAEICNGDTYNQFGFNGDSTGVYVQNFQTTNGCDSNFYLNLIVNYVPSPLYLSLHNAANYIELNWAGHEPLYIIYRDNDSLAMVTTNIYKDTNVVEGRSYCYKLKALNGECESEFGQQECYTYTLLNDVVNNRITTKLYPNPADNKTILEVNGLTSSADIIIYDIYSRAINTYRIDPSKKELEIDVRGLAKGIYTIKIISQNLNQTQKLIVK